MINPRNHSAPRNSRYRWSSARRWERLGRKLITALLLPLILSALVARALIIRLGKVDGTGRNEFLIIS
jgi:hypothetical protein